MGLRAGLAVMAPLVLAAALHLGGATWTVFLTPTFVLLAEATEGNRHLASLRVLNTLLGGALAGERPPGPLPHPGSFAPSSDDPILRARLERIARQIQTLHEAARRWETGGMDAGASERAAREVA